MSRRRALLGPVAAVAAVVLTVGATALHGAYAGTVSRTAAAPVAAASTGCGQTPTLTSGTHTIQSSGKSRSYILKIPDNYDRSHPYRLVFGFHWVGGTAVDVATGRTVQTDVWAYYGLLRLSNNSTIFVAPQGLNNGWGNSGGQDVTFVDDMIQQIEGDLCVDTTQLFSVGFSYGAAMTYALACARPTVFRAVAVQSGGTLSGCSGGTQPIAYLGVHGIRDGVLNIAGGRGLRDRFVRNNGCTPQNPPEPTQGSRMHIVTAYSGCSAGHPVVWAAFDEGHIAAPQDGAGGDNGTKTWVPALVWSFFTQFQSTPPPPTTPPATTPPSTTPPATTPPTGTPPSTTPPTSATPTTPPATGQPGTCTATARVTSSWPGGLQVEVTVANNGPATLNGWTVGLTLASGQTITNVWNGINTGTSGAVTVRNAAYNGVLTANASTSFGFIASGNSAFLPAAMRCMSA